MYVQISADGNVSLEDIDNFKAFSIVTDLLVENWPPNVKAMMSAADESRFWLDADAVIDLSPKHGDTAWVDQFWAILKAAERYGFSDVEGRRIKAHVSKHLDP